MDARLRWSNCAMPRMLSVGMLILCPLLPKSTLHCPVQLWLQTFDIPSDRRSGRCNTAVLLRLERSQLLLGALPNLSSRLFA